MASTSHMPSLIEDAVINNEPDNLKKLLEQADVNISLNNTNDSALLLAVKLSHRAIVKTLLSSPKCDLAHLNINSYSPLDRALVSNTNHEKLKLQQVMVYNNQKEPRQSACWDILEMLLEAGAEPACQNAMSYVVRNALKWNDDQFIFRLICTLLGFSISLNLHSMFLCKLHRSQPIYSGLNSDTFFERTSDFSIKLIKLHGTCSLQPVVECLDYYLNSHWDNRSKKEEIITKLIVFITIFGWKWTSGGLSSLYHLYHLCPFLAQWCHQMPCKTHSLTHLCRISLTRSPSLRQKILQGNIPSLLHGYLRFTDIDSLMPLGYCYDFDSIQL